LSDFPNKPTITGQDWEGGRERREGKEGGKGGRERGEGSSLHFFIADHLIQPH